MAAAATMKKGGVSKCDRDTCSMSLATVVRTCDVRVAAAVKHATGSVRQLLCASMMSLSFEVHPNCNRHCYLLLFICDI